MLCAVRRYAPILILVSLFNRSAAAATIGFESLNEFDAVTNQFAGVTFLNATVLTAGSSLNEFDNPPNSGTNVVFDDGGFMSIVFGSPVSSFGGYFTYALTPSTRLTLTAFNSANAPLGSIFSAFSNNQGTAGDPGSLPNEYLQLLFSNIKSVRIAGEVTGSSFSLDDVTYTPNAAPVAEPSTMSLMVLGSAALFRKIRRRAVDKRA
jgi:hypothetical protein